MKSRSVLFTLLLSFLAPWATTFAEDTRPHYQMPPQNIVDLIDAPLPPRVIVSPDNRWMLLMTYPVLIPLSEVAEPELRLAGLRIRPTTNGPSRNAYNTEISLMRLADKTQRKITGLPPNAKLGDIRWSPDGSRFAFTVTDAQNVELWVAEAEKVVTKRVLRQRLNAAIGTPYEWLPDGKGFVVSIVPEGRGPEPSVPLVPDGPITQENMGKTKPARTFQDLLKNPYDETLFDHYGASQLMWVNLEGDRERIGNPAIFVDFDPAPSGEFLLVQITHRPYSYQVPLNRFPRKIEIWDRKGKVVKTLADVPLQEGVPITFGSVPTGPRAVGWRSDAPATLSWVEAQDGGDAGVPADVRDAFFLLPAPFSGKPVTLARLSQRFGGMTWGTGDLAVVSDWWWKTRNTRTWLVKPDAPETEPVKLYDRSMEDEYNDPGAFVTRTNRVGREVLLQGAGGTLFLVGDGDSPDGKRPFVDRLDLGTKEATRLWRSEAPYYESPIELLDDQGARLLTRRESKEIPPNFFIRTLASGDLQALTEFPHPYPTLEGISKELLHYERADSVKLTGTLYLPAGYKAESGPLPCVMWVYPQEFKSADLAGQVTDSPYQFDHIYWASPLVWLSQGYAVFDDPKLPIVGEGETEPNDTYVKQLVMGAEAAVEAVVAKGVVDRERIAIGGHSYGAFTTANLLEHTDLFRAGIARSGAYNRSLTPFGFQAEERTFWQAPEAYTDMSPFTHADRMNEPLLLVHGEADSNPGTFPMQTERFFDALKGLGATARMVMLPHESHSYRARESVLHMLWETDRWLDTYVKQAKPRSALPGERSAIESTH